MENPSLLARTLSHATVVPRPMSAQADAVNRHAMGPDLEVDEFDFDFDVVRSRLAGRHAASLQDVFALVQYQNCLVNQNNFSATGARIECLNVDAGACEWLSVDDVELPSLLQGIQDRDAASPPRMVVFFAPRMPATNTSYGSRTSLSQVATASILAASEIDPAFLMNMLGRPDYWAPRTSSRTTQDGELLSFELSLQHPRWNLQVQGSPLSVCMKYNPKKNLTTYMVAHKSNDTTVIALRKLLDLSLCAHNPSLATHALLDDPLEIHVMVATLSFEASKHHVKRFQRFMWEQFNKVDDHFEGAEMKERFRLDDVTKQLQVISLNADSHLANAGTAITNASSVRHAHARLHCVLRPNSTLPKQASADAIDYLMASLEKQKMWFLNYKSRKDNTMGLVYNLVTQQDAANNIGIATEMRKDSSSMHAIAALTMVFLPGTFTATVLGAGLFTVIAHARLNVGVSAIWWLWLIITLPLTIGVMLAWYFYQRRQVQKATGRSTVAVAVAVAAAGKLGVVRADAGARSDWRGRLGLSRLRMRLSRGAGTKGDDVCLQP